MKFRYVVLLKRDYDMDHRELPAVVRLGGDYDVIARFVQREDRGPDLTLANVAVECISEFRPGLDTEAALRRYASGDVFHDSEVMYQPGLESEENRAKLLIQPTGLPRLIVELGHTVGPPLYAASREVVTLLRWRFDLYGASRAIAATEGLSWSDDDGVTWDTLPAFGTVSGSVRGIPRLKGEVLAAVEELARAGASEPLAQSLIREARELMRTPGTALVVGMMALEVGVKQLIADLVPDAAWFVEDIPSPPVVKLVRGIDHLPVKLGSATDPPRVPKSIIREIQKGTEARNQVVHRGDVGLRLEEISSVLEAVKDVLHLCDFYGGASWALEHVRSDTLAELKLT